LTHLGEDARRTGRRTGDSGTREAILAAARTRFGDHGYAGATIRAIAADAGVDPALVHHFFGTKERLFAAAMRLPVIPGELISAALAPGARDPGRSLGEHLLRTVLGAWAVDEVRETFLGLMRSAVTSEQAAAMLREFATDSILDRLAEVAGAAGVAGVAGASGGFDAAGALYASEAPDTADTDGASDSNGAPDTDGAAGVPGAADADGFAEADFRAALVASQVLGLALTRFVLRLEPLAAASQDDLAAAIGPTLERYLTGQIR
jgi:AcrR family transcriptional regulator